MTITYNEALNVLNASIEKAKTLNIPGALR